MESQKILKLLNAATNSIFVTRKWSIFIVQSNVNSSVGNEIIYSKGLFKSNLCDYNEDYILVKSDMVM